MPTRLLLGTLTVLILAGAVGTVYFQHQSAQHAARAAALERDLAQARAETVRERDRGAKLLAKANELDTHLGTAKTRTTATEAKNSQLTRELTVTKSSLTERQQREVALLAEIESLRQQMQTATDHGATSPLPPSSATLTTNPASATTTAASTSDVHVGAYRERIAALETQLTELLTRALAEPVATDPSPADSGLTTTAATEPTHQVVRVGPHDAFVIVDFGRDEGAEIGDELTLYRGTVVVARVQISDARAKFSVAQVLPAALKRQLQPGDFVLIAK